VSRQETSEDGREECTRPRHSTSFHLRTTARMKGASKPAPGEASAMDGGWTTAGPVLRNHPPKHADRCARRIFRRLPSPCRRTDGRITHDAQTERALISHTNGTVATGSVDDKKRVAYVVTHHLPTCQAIVSWMA
jgi:hypothetical protein